MTLFAIIRMIDDETAEVTSLEVESLEEAKETIRDLMEFGRKAEEIGMMYQLEGKDTVDIMVTIDGQTWINEPEADAVLMPLFRDEWEDE